MSANALRTFCFLILSATFCVTAGAEPASKTKLAVMNLKAQGGINQQVALILTELMTTEISKIDTFDVINRDDMQTMLAHIADKQLLGCDDTKCLVKIGGALGVEYLVSGNLGKVGDRYVISLKLINIDNAEVKNRISDKNAQNEGQLISNIEKSVYELFGKSRHSIYAEQGGGDLFITSDRNGTEVHVDGVVMEGRAPLTLENVATGTHLIEGHNGSYYAKRVIDLPPNGLVKVNLTMSRAQGVLKVFSNPAGASVIIGGKIRGATPLMVENIASGKQHITLRLNDYLDYTLSVDMEQGVVEKVNADLVPAAYITVKPKPERAVVSLNSQIVDFSNEQEMMVPAGSVRVVVRADHYDSVVQVVDVPHRRHHTVNADLKYKFAVLDVKTVPESATVYLDFKKQGLTNYYDKFIEPGEYMLRIAKASYKNVDKKLVLERHRKETLFFMLEHTDVYLDSVKKAKAAFKRKRQRIQKIGFSAASVVFGSIALYHEFAARNDLDEQDRIVGVYNDGVYGADFAGYKHDYNVAGRLVDDHISARNLYLSLSGVNAGMFGLSFVF